jgi:hypothetical protein
MKPKRLPEFEDPPWITPDGFFDPAKFPIEVPIRQCLDPTSGDFRDGCTFLGNMASRGRVDAGIFLLGLLRYYEEDLAVATIIVECLQHFHDARCVRVLISELRRVPSSNRTRRYLDTVINTLRLNAGRNGQRTIRRTRAGYSYKMRAKFASAGEEVAYRWHSSHDLEDRA